MSMTTAPVTAGGSSAPTHAEPQKCTVTPTSKRIAPAPRIAPVTDAELPPCALMAATEAINAALVPR